MERRLVVATNYLTTIFYVSSFLGHVGQTALAESKRNLDCELRLYIGGTPWA